jgi:hypothetical protein
MMLTTTCHFSCLLETKILHLALCPKIGGHYRIHARKIINGIDQAERIAGYAKNFEACLSE